MEYIKEKRILQVIYGQEADLTSWMELVNHVSWNFPGLETSEAIKEHADTVLHFMKKQQAICVKDGDKVVGVLLFSRTHNMICCLAVSPDYRRKHIGASMLEEALLQLDRTRDISVSTFREEDPKGVAPRALYRKFGFVEDELIEEFGYPNQRFVLSRSGIV